MPNLLDKLFKPKWKHARADVRLEAIKALSWENEQDWDILESCLANDPAPEVRKQALKQLQRSQDFGRLVRSRNKFSHDFMPLLGELAQEDEAFLAPLVQGLVDSPHCHLLFDIPAAHQYLPDLLSGIEEKFSASLPEWILGISGASERLALASQINNRAILEALNRLSKGRDKSLYQQTKGRLQSYRDQERQRKATLDELAAIGQQLEALAQTAQTTHYSEKVRSLATQLERYREKAPAELIEKADSALQRCLKREAERQAEREASAKAEAEQTAQRLECEGTLEVLNETESRVFKAPLTAVAEAAALDALIKTQAIRWQEACAGLSEPPEHTARYQDLISSLENYLGSLQRYLNAVPDLESALATLSLASETEKKPTDPIASLRTLTHFIQWPAAYPAPEPLNKARKALGAQNKVIAKEPQKDYSEERAKVSELLDDLSTAIESGSVRQAQQLLREAHDALKALPDNRKRDLQAQLRNTQKQLENLKDWAGFATRPKQEELISKMAHLAGQTLEPHDKARKIRLLQNEWKALGGSSERALWEDFKAVSDKAYEPCRVYFEQESQLKRGNLEKRQEIASQLELYLQSTDWQSNQDWKTVERINRQARQDWRRFYPVDHKAGKSLQSRFNQLLKQLDEHLNSERLRNVEKKQDIVKQANALIAEADLKRATEQAKELQKVWQSIGITPANRDRELWKDFRAACDAIFGRLSAEKAERNAQKEQNRNDAIELIAALAALKEEVSLEKSDVLLALRSRFSELSAQAKLDKSLQQQFDSEWRACQAKLSAERKQQRVEAWSCFFQESLARRFNSSTEQETNLCLQTEPDLEKWLLQWPHPLRSPNRQHSPQELVLLIEILAGIDSPNEEQSVRMALQVERLATGMQTQSAPPIKRLEDLGKSWLLHPELTLDLAQSQLTRVQRASEAVITRYAKD